MNSHKQCNITKISRSLLTTLCFISFIPAVGLFGSGEKVGELLPSPGCAAYKVEKAMFWVADVEVIGRNCSITSTWKKGTGGIYIEVKIPVSAFDSGSSTRDEDVAPMLGGAGANMVFRSQAMAPAQWQAKLKASQVFNLQGAMTVAGKTNNLTWQVQPAEGRVLAWTQTTFEALGLEPPKVGPGAMMADVQSNLALYTHMALKEIGGGNLLGGGGL